jgi:hypothetical protein
MPLDGLWLEAPDGTSKSENEHSIPQVNDNHSNESRHAWFVNDI